MYPKTTTTTYHHHYYYYYYYYYLIMTTEMAAADKEDGKGHQTQQCLAVPQTVLQFVSDPNTFTTKVICSTRIWTVVSNWQLHIPQTVTEVTGNLQTNLLIKKANANKIHTHTHTHTHTQMDSDLDTARPFASKN